MAEKLDSEQLAQEIEQIMTPASRRWLADYLHNKLAPPVTNASIQAEIVLRAWDKMPEMAHDEMKELKVKLDAASALLVELIRTVTPPAKEVDEE